MNPEHLPVDLDMQFDAEPDEAMWSAFLARLAEADWNIHKALQTTPETSRMWFARHTITSTLLHTLASDLSAFVRRAVADSAYVAPEDLDILAHDADVFVRYRVALSCNVSCGTLALLGRDKSNLVRRAVALHPRATSAMLSLLAQDDNPMVRRSAITHPNVDPNLFWTLRNDPDSQVRHAARTRLEARRRSGGTR